MAKERTVQVNFDVEESLQREFKLAVLHNKTSMSSVLREHIKKYVSESKKNIIY